MNVIVTNNLEESKAELVITATPGDLTPYKDRAAKAISKEHPLKGFRPGKVPLKVLAEKLGEAHVLQHILDEAVPQLFVQAAVQEEVEAIDRPSISVSKATIDGELEFTATVDILPKVTLADPKKINVEKRDVKVDDAHIEKELEHIARSRSTYTDVTRPSTKGDIVTVDFDIMHEGKTIEGGESKEHPIPLGEGHFVPGFEDGITGITAGEEKTFPLTFPDDYPKEDLRGKALEARVKAHKVQERVMPKIDDEFAKSLGKFENLTELKTELQKNIEAEKVSTEKERYLGELAEQLAEASTFTRIPEILIEREIDNRLHEFSHMLSMQQRTIDDYLAQQNKTLKEVREDMKETAEKTVRVGLVLRAFAKDQDIEVSDEEIEKEATAELARYKTVPQAEEEADAGQLKERVAAQIRNRKTLDRLAEMTGK